MFDPDELFVVDEPAWRCGPTGSPASVIDYSPDGTLVAYSNVPGKVTVVSAYDGQVKRTLEQTYSSAPITGCKFHPSEETMLLATSRDGHIFLFDMLKGEVVQTTRHLGSNLAAMTIDSFGETFAIACADGSLRMYDVENLQRTKALVKMGPRSGGAQVMNVYSLVFHPEDSNVLLAAGWNDRVLLWDVRTGNAERSIAGPHVHGPALDIQNDQILTGSARDKKQIEIWDYGTGKKVKDVSVAYPSGYSGPSMLVNAAKYARNGMDIVAGGAGYTATQVFEGTKGKFVGETKAFATPVAACVASPFGSGFVSGAENGEVICHMVRLRQA